MEGRRGDEAEARPMMLMLLVVVVFSSSSSLFRFRFRRRFRSHPPHQGQRLGLLPAPRGQVDVVRVRVRGAAGQRPHESRRRRGAGAGGGRRRGGRRRTTALVAKELAGGDAAPELERVREVAVQVDPGGVLPPPQVEAVRVDRRGQVEHGAGEEGGDARVGVAARGALRSCRRRRRSCSSPSSSVSPPPPRSELRRGQLGVEGADVLRQRHEELPPGGLVAVESRDVLHVRAVPPASRARRGRRRRRRRFFVGGVGIDEIPEQAAGVVEVAALDLCDLPLLLRHQSRRPSALDFIVIVVPYAHHDEREPAHGPADLVDARPEVRAAPL